MQNAKFTFKTSTVATAVALAALAAGIANPAWADTTDTPSAPPTAQTATHASRAEHYQERIQARLTKMQEKLKITDSQQAAWQAYATAYQARFEKSGTADFKKDPNATATTLAKQRADRATRFAQKQKEFASATARLDASLNPEQRRILAEMTSHHPHHKHFFHHGKGHSVKPSQSS